MKETVLSYGELKSIGISEFAKKEPEMLEIEYKLLKEDIEANGLLNPLVIYNREIYDGRHRYKASKELSIDVMVIYASGKDDAKRMAISNNRHRRHLSKNQYAMMAAKDINESNKKLTIKESPYIINGYVSESYVKRCLRIIKDGPSYVNDVFNGKKSIQEVLTEMNKKNKKPESNNSPYFIRTKDFLNSKLGIEVDEDLKKINNTEGLQKLDFIKEMLYMEYKLKDKLKDVDKSIQIDSILKEIKKEYDKDVSDEIAERQAEKDEKEKERLAKKAKAEQDKLERKAQRAKDAEAKRLAKLEAKSGGNSSS